MRLEVVMKIQRARRRRSMSVRMDPMLWEDVERFKAAAESRAGVEVSMNEALTALVRRGLAASEHRDST